MFKGFILSMISIFFFISANAWADNWSELNSLLPTGAQISYLVEDIKNNKIIVEHQSEILRLPASTQKVLTATAAKLYLGDNFKYKTTIEGKKSNIMQGVYHGDLRFQFVGDPTLLRNDIKNMLFALKKQGIKTIKGNFYLNSSHFNGYQWSNGEVWNDLGICFTSPSNAIIVNKNCVNGNLSLKSKKAKKARLYIPSYDPVNITANVDVVSKKQRLKSFCDLELTRNSHNNYHLHGCAVLKNKPLGLSFAVNDPFDYTKKIVAAELDKVGIKLKGKIQLEKTPFSASGVSELAVHESPALTKLLHLMLKESDNLIADSLFKTLGSAYYKRPGNFRNGAKALKQILKAHGIDLENSHIADGSGLSRHNLISAEVLMSVLHYIYKHDDKLKLLEDFPIAAVDGTLKDLGGVQTPKFKGNIIAKTGGMDGVANILGIAKTPYGVRFFVVIINGCNSSSDQNKLKVNCKVAIDNYQQAFFKQVFSAQYGQESEFGMINIPH